MFFNDLAWTFDPAAGGFEEVIVIAVVIEEMVGSD
jgi:hypothetical protein